MDERPPIVIVRRKKKGHAAHHGGAWKVAYADFVTAMMAFPGHVAGQLDFAGKEGCRFPIFQKLQYF